MKEYTDFWKNYTNFSGKTNCRGYWMYVLINFLLMMGVSLALAMAQSLNEIQGLSEMLGLATLGYSVASIVPGLAITVRRLRDAGKKWTYIFMSLIPIAGPVIMLLTLAKPSITEANISNNNYCI